MVASPAFSAGEIRSALAAARLRERDVQRPDGYIGIQGEITLITRLAEPRGGAGAAARAALSVPWKPGSLMTYLVSASRTLDDAITQLARYASISRPLNRVRVHRNMGPGPFMEFALAPVPIPYTPEWLGWALAANVLMVQGCTGRTDLPGRIEIAEDLPLDTAELSDAVRLPVIRGRTTGFSFTPSMLQADVTSGDEHLRVHLKSYAEALLSDETRLGVHGEFAARVVELLAEGKTSIGAVAKSLGMSDRSLRRKLAAEGVTFRELVERVRYEVSVQLLSAEELPLAEIAFLLGYESQSAFTSFFKRRSAGLTPTRMRLQRGSWQLPSDCPT
jgi:AraC-like DNA-binding protein